MIQRPATQLILAISLCLMVLTPILVSGYRGDDQNLPIEYLAKGKEQDLNTVETAWTKGRDSINQYGRIIPGAFTLMVLEHGVLTERKSYKALLVTLSLVFLGATAFLVARLSGLPLVVGGGIVALTAAVAIQFRTAPTLADPYLSGNGLTQIAALLIILGVLSHYKGQTGRMKRWLVGAGALFTSACILYEGGVALAPVFVLLAIFLASDVRQGLGWGSPYLVGAALLGVAALLARQGAIDAIYAAGYSPVLDLGGMVRVIALLSIAAIPLTFALSSPSLFVEPGVAEVVWGILLGLVTFLVTLLLLSPKGPLFQGEGQRDHELPREGGKLTDRALVVLGVLFIVLPNVPLSIVGVYQEEVGFGRAHLTGIYGVIGVALLFGVLVRHVAARGLGPKVRILAPVAIGVIAMATAVSNLRLILVERPGVEQRDALEAFVGSGVADGILSGNTVLITNQDFGWGPGNLAGAFNELVFLRRGLNTDVRLLDDVQRDCGGGYRLASDKTPRGICRPTRSGGVWLLRLRTSRGRETVILTKLSTKGDSPVGAISKRLVAGRSLSERVLIFLRGFDGTSVPPLVGVTASGKDFDAASVEWARHREADGWERFVTAGRMAERLEVMSLGDPASGVDFYAASSGELSPSQAISLFGRRSLITDWLPFD